MTIAQSPLLSCPYYWPVKVHYNQNLQNQTYSTLKITLSEWTQLMRQEEVSKTCLLQLFISPKHSAWIKLQLLYNYYSYWARMAYLIKSPISDSLPFLSCSGPPLIHLHYILISPKEYLTLHRQDDGCAMVKAALLLNNSRWVRSFGSSCVQMPSTLVWIH